MISSVRPPISWKSWSRFCRPRCVAFSETIRHRVSKSLRHLMTEGCEAVLAHLNEGTSEGDAN